MSQKVYIGDSVYADFDGEQVVLTTENGYGPTNTIFLDHTTAVALLEYLKRMGLNS
jgi:hypothetical protein